MNEKAVKRKIVGALLTKEQLDQRAREIYDNKKVMDYIATQADFFEQNEWTLIEIAQVGRMLLNFVSANLAANSIDKPIKDILDDITADILQSKINDMLMSEKP